MGADTSTLRGVNDNAQLKSERFELANDEFTLDKDALKKFFKCSDRECDILFSHFDMDGNGKIDSYEFICALSMLSHATLEEKAELIFNLYDFDGSKYISRDELVILMTNSLTALKSMQKKPAPSIQEIEKKTDEFFKQSDTDGDQKITLKEFKDYITKDKQILEVLITCDVAKKEDLGMDFGKGDSQVPDVDKDLEAECNPKELTDKKSNIKEGIDFNQKANKDEMFEEQEMDKGDQFMAVKPWIGVVQNSIPSKYKPNKRDGEAPDATLQLEHIYGYRCHDTRNNLRYTAKGDLVYHAAGVGIVHNAQANTQKFLLEHNDDIHCLAIDPTGQFCATGQIGKNPWLFIWNNSTMECVARIQGHLQKGVMQVAFSNDGKYIAASAMDDDHTIAVYDWQTKPKTGQAIKPITIGKGTRANILSLGFNPQGNQLVATCVKEVNFFTFDQGVIKGQKGTGWPNSQAESVLCQAFVDNVLVTGTFSGSLVQWNGRNIAGKPIKAHQECINAMIERKTTKGIITGGNDGLVILWTFTAGTFQQEKQFDIKGQDVRSLMPKVRSICENPTTKMILVGTRGGEIVELGGAKPVVHMRSHCDGELWGLTSHPQKSEFITIGQDNMLAIWDIATKRQKKFARLDCSGNVLAYSHDGSKLAIGYTNGSVTVLDANFQVLAIRKDRKEAIQEIKFSPDSSILAVGAHDSMIFTYDANANFKPLKKLRGHHSTITHFDFSQDGKYLMSNCTSYEILFFDLASGKQVTGGASQFRDEVWKSWTCTLGWPVQGIFPPCADGSDINACDRAPDGTVLATGDDFGMVKLFRYPCPVEKACFNQYIGHSSHVTNVRFIPKSNYLISTGGEDKTIFQWKYFLDKEGQAQSTVTKTSNVEVTNIMQDEGGDDMFQEEEMKEGDQRLAVLPFKGEIMAPSGYCQGKDAANAPNGNLKLKYAHGFRSFDTRGNLKYTKSANEIVYTTAALGVVLNKQSNTQKFFNLHQDDVVALAIHPNKDIIATGQMAAKGKAKVIDIFVWNASTQECLAQINGFHRRAVRNLAFSPSGDKLLSIGEDDFHSAAVYDWTNKRMLCNAKVDPDKVFDACWKDDTEFMTVGMKHVKFFTIQGQNLTPSKGIYGTMGPTAMICCAYAFANKTPLTGTPKGELVVWNGRTVGKAQKAHTDALWAILSVDNNSTLITGGNDAKIILWDKAFAQVKTIDLNPMSQFQPGVRSLDYNEQTKALLVGTRGAEIIEVNTATGKKMSTLIYGHFEGSKQAELWGLAVHPKEQLFASCGADNTVRVWSENTMIKASQPFPNDLTAIDWASNGQFLVVGDRNGYVYSVDAETLTQQGVIKGANADKNNAWIEDVKIAPNCKVLAFGSHGGRSKIDIVKILDNGKKLQKQASVDIGISSSLTHLDFSQDSNAIVINSQAYELMWLDVNNQQRIMASSAKDIEFATWTCVLGFPVQGIWPGPDFTDVNSTCRSNSRQVLATADDFGMVKIFKYPCVVEQAANKAYMGHSSHVTKVKFSANDKFVLSAGGNDKTVIVWETDFALGSSVLNEDKEVPQVNDDDEFSDAFNEVREDRSKIEKQKAKAANIKKLVTQEDDLFEVHDVGEGDEFMAVKPWIGQMKNPTGYQKPPKNQELAPNIKLELEWVHGYRSRDAKNNIAYLVDGSIAYHAAGLGVCYDPAEHSQRFFNKHTDDVLCIAFSSDKRTIATGEIGKKPKICIYDGITMTEKFVLQGKLANGIQHVAFSPSGKVLAAVAMDDNHSIAVYNVDTGALMGTTQGDKAQILELAFKDETEFSSAGIKHFMNWKIGATLTSSRGQFAKYDPRIGSCKYSGNNCLTGSITGELYIWTGGSISQAKKLHEKPLDAIYCHQSYVLTGGRDCKVNILSTTFQPIYSFTIDEQQFQSGIVRALCLNEQANQLLIGTFGSEIYQVQIDITKKSTSQPKIYVQGHYSPCRKDNNEVWGLTAFPKKDMYASCSDDGTLRVWDATQRKQIKVIKLNFDNTGKELPLDPQTQELAHQSKARCLDISPDEKYCAVGFRDGSFRIYEIQKNWAYTAKKKPSDQIISDIKFSPDNKFLAVAAHDFKIQIFALPTLERKCILKASTSGVTHIDWSIDSLSIHSNDLSYEILYYNVSQGSQVPSGASTYRDEHWHTWTLPLGWPVQGIWPPCTDGSDINAVDRSKKPTADGHHLLASADDFSKVKIFRYPSVCEESKFVEGVGHSSHVTHVKFSRDDFYLFSAGGNDTCIFQWKIEQ